MKRCLLLTIVVCALLCGTAAADIGYTRVSMIPEAVDFTWDVSTDENGAVVIVTDYPFEKAEAMAMRLDYCDTETDEWRAGFSVSAEGETTLVGFAGFYAGEEEATEKEMISALMEDLETGRIVPDSITIFGPGESWWLQYLISENAYCTYGTSTKREDSGRLEQIIAFTEDGVIHDSTVYLYRDMSALYLFYGKYGTMLDCRIQIDEDGQYSEIMYDSSAGLFEGQPIEAFGFSQSDLTDHIPAALSKPERSDNVSDSLAGAKDITVHVNEPFVIRKSDFSLFPAESLIAGYGNYDEAWFDVYAYNYLFRGKSETEWFDTDGTDPAIRITPREPGYYSMYAYCGFDDEDSTMLQSEYFLLTVLNADGSKPEKLPVMVSIYTIPSGTVGETIQINWHIKNLIRPYKCTIQIEKDGAVLDTWCYEDTWRDTYTFQGSGAYIIRVKVEGKYMDSASDEQTLIVTEPSPLVLKSLLLSKDETDAGKLNWKLDYTGGQGTKTTLYRLENTSTGETADENDQGNLATWFASGLPAGVYVLKMNVADDVGDHLIESNPVTLLPEWDLVLPSSVEAIEDSAFRGIPDVAVYIPEGCTRIGAGAFADSAVTCVYIPATAMEIAQDALPAGTMICTPAGSPVIDWAGDDYPIVITE